MDEPVPLSELGLKLTFMPVGSPAADKAMGEEKPPDKLIVTVTELLLPRVSTSEGGPADSVNPAAVVVVVDVNALINPLPFGLPQPVTRS